MGLHFQESLKEEEGSRAILCNSLAPYSHHLDFVSLAQCFILVEDINQDIKLESNLLINGKVKAVSLFKSFYESIVKGLNQILALVNTDRNRVL